MRRIASYRLFVALALLFVFGFPSRDAVGLEPEPQWVLESMGWGNFSVKQLIDASQEQARSGHPEWARVALRAALYLSQETGEPPPSQALFDATMNIGNRKQYDNKIEEAFEAAEAGDPLGLVNLAMVLTDAKELGRLYPKATTDALFVKATQKWAQRGKYARSNSAIPYIKRHFQHLIEEGVPIPKKALKYLTPKQRLAR